MLLFFKEIPFNLIHSSALHVNLPPQGLNIKGQARFRKIFREGGLFGYQALKNSGFTCLKYEHSQQRFMPPVILTPEGMSSVYFDASRQHLVGLLFFLYAGHFAFLQPKTCQQFCAACFCTAPPPFEGYTYIVCNKFTIFYWILANKRFLRQEGSSG